MRAVTTPYRNETEALNERKATLERELAQLKAQTSELAGLKAREAELEREMRAIAEKLGAATKRRLLPLLDQVKVASPCNASWDEMVGDERVRFCLSCEKNVYNISAMPRAEAEQFLEARAGGELCIRYYQRADGTILTSDCPVGVKRKRRKQLALAVAGAGAMAVAVASSFRQTCETRMGEMKALPTQPTPVLGSAAPIEATPPYVAPDATPATPTAPPTTAPTQHVLGRRALPPKR